MPREDKSDGNERRQPCCCDGNSSHEWYLAAPRGRTTVLSSLGIAWSRPNREIFSDSLWTVLAGHLRHLICLNTLQRGCSRQKTHDGLELHRLRPAEQNGYGGAIAQPLHRRDARLRRRACACRIVNQFPNLLDPEWSSRSRNWDAACRDQDARGHAAPTPSGYTVNRSLTEHSRWIRAANSMRLKPISALRSRDEMDFQSSH